MVLMRCPVCECEFDPASRATTPFCSERCRTIDLGRWLDEGYAVPVVPDPEADEKPELPWIDDEVE
ncbi:MAG: DNA gyrase inhibitor YacG [Pirellulales bacterium]|nr:DNA gyrase inhibitor YacG [Pirellulales bacterium]